MDHALGDPSGPSGPPGPHGQFLPGPPDEAPYVASARWDGAGWWVHVRLPCGRPVGTTRAPRLVHVEHRARQLLALAGEHPAEIAVEADVPASVHLRLDVADELRSGIVRPSWIVGIQLQEAQRELSDLGLDEEEIALLLGDQRQPGRVACTPPRE